MPRLRFKDFRLSRAPSLVGLCNEDSVRVAAIANAAQQRLLNAPEAGEEGWYGTWAEVAFTLNQLTPYWTAGREIARAQLFSLCETPIVLNNPFGEYLNFGNGRMPKTFQTCTCTALTQSFLRNNAPTFCDITTPPKYIAAFPSDPTDVGKKVLIQGLDSNGNTVYGRQGITQVLGQYLTLEMPFVISPQSFNRITGIQKDTTTGPVQFFSMDPATATQVLLLTMEPSEETANYRRYYFNNLPVSCCGTTFSGLPGVTTPQDLTATAICALEPIPVKVDTDWLLIQNLEALIAEAQSIYYSEKESKDAKMQSRERHKQAVSLLIGECTRYLGKENPAVNFRPFGSAHLSRVRINMT